MNKRLEDHEKRIAALERQLEDGKVATTQIKDAWMSAYRVSITSKER